MIWVACLFRFAGLGFPGTARPAHNQYRSFQDQTAGAILIVGGRFRWADKLKPQWVRYRAIDSLTNPWDALTI